MRWVPAILLIIAGLGPAAAAEEPVLRLPLGLPAEALKVPADNPLTPEKIALGKQIFWDRRWSKTGTVSCQSCHWPERAWSVERSVNSAGKLTRRHAPTIINRVFSTRQHWGGENASLEMQALTSKDTTPEAVVQNLGAIKAYQEQFQRVFGTPVTAENVAKAIAAYVRTIVSANSPYDRFRAGDATAISAAARRGLSLFEGKARCAVCHRGFNFTDEGYHNIGIGMDHADPDLGRFAVTQRDINKGAFKTPTLRDVTRRSPYMHDASLGTLSDVIDYYDRGGRPNPWLSPDITPLNLTAEERQDLFAFLEALTGDVARETASPPSLPADE